jgi:AraC-like DNA-binding protein
MTDSTDRPRVYRGESGGSRWEMVNRRPSCQVQPYVCGDYVGYTEWAASPSRRREFAVPFVVAVIQFGPPIAVLPEGDARRRVSHRSGFSGGLDDRFAVCEHSGFQCGLQFFLTPIGARLLFGVPMSELAGQILPIDQLLPRRHRDLRERLHDLDDWNARFDLLDAVLREAFDGAHAHAGVSWALARIAQRGGVLDLKLLASDIGYSQKHVTTLFRDHVGTTPKRFARITRFHRLVTHLRRGGSGAWADLAARFGYYDQAHLAHEVRALTGITPSELRPLAADVLASLSERG